MKFDEASIDRFLSRIRCDKGCWGWSSYTTVDGYGSCWMRWEGGAKYLRAHRISWVLFRGDIPPGQSVLHRCDNSPCTNPNHLFLGSQQDNIYDMLNKGRHRVPRGTAHCDAKLSELDVKAIRWLRSIGVCRRDLADTYNIGVSNVKKITAGRIWKHV